MIHPLAKNLGFKSNSEFYKSFPTKDSYDQYMKGGQIDPRQNQALPPDYSVPNSLKNVDQTRSDGYKRPNQIPFVMQQGPNVLKKTGGPGSPNNNYTNAGGIYSYQQGGPMQQDSQWNYAEPIANASNPNFRDYGSMYAVDNGATGLYQKPVNMEQEFAGFDNPASNVNYNPSGYSGFGHSGESGVTASAPQKSGLAATGFPTREEAIAKYKAKSSPSAGQSIAMSDYNMHGGESEEMKKGGHWIQKAVNPAHKGYCTPMSKSTCTPHRKALAMTFKKHHGFHQDGGEINSDQYMYNPGGNYQVGGLYHNQINPDYGTFTPDGIRVAQMGWNGAPIPTANNLRGQEYGCPQDLNYQVGGLYHNQTNPNYGTWAPFGIRVAQEGGMNFNAPANTVGSGYQYQPDKESVPQDYSQDNSSSNAWTSTTPQLSEQDANAGKNAAGPIPEQGSYASQQGAAYDTTGVTDSPSKQRSKWPAYVGAGVGAVTGALAGIGAVAGRNQKTRNAAGARMNQGMTSSQYPHSNPIGSKGDAGMVGQGYGQNLSHFGAGNVGSFYQPIAQKGMMVTPYNKGGMYQAGGEYEITDQEAKMLEKQGYKLQYL